MGLYSCSDNNDGSFQGKHNIQSMSSNIDTFACRSLNNDHAFDR